MTIFLLKSKLSTAKKSKTTTFSRVFHPKKIDNFLGKSKLNLWTKNEDFEHCDCYCSWTLWLLERTSISLAVASLLMEESLWLTISKQSQLTRIPLLALQLQVSLPSTYDFDHSFENLLFFTATGSTFTLGFQTVTGAAAITGFDLVYQQVPCS